MRWQDFRRSDNVEESTDSGSSGIGGIHLGIGGVIVVIVISLLLGKNPLDILALLSDSGAPTQTQAPAPSGPPGAGAPRDEQTEFVARVLGDTEDVWTGVFQQRGGHYQPPKLVLFAVRRLQRADSRARQPALSIARVTATYTWISRFSRSCRSVSARQVTSHAPT
jgi:predicted metalloprotease